MADKKTTPNYRVPALERALDVLSYLSKQTGACTLDVIAKELSIPKASLFRILHTFTMRGYVCLVAENGYALGDALSQMDQKANSIRMLSSIAQPFLMDLAFLTGQVSQLSVLVDTGVMYINAALPPNEVSIIAPLRKVLPVNISAGGKSLLAFCSLVEQKEFLCRSPLANNTVKSITEADAFLEELMRIRHRGYALDDEEFAIGIGCLAMPVFNAAGTAVAAVGTTGRYVMYDSEEKINSICRSIKKVRDAFSERLCSIERTNSGFAYFPGTSI